MAKTNQHRARAVKARKMLAKPYGRNAYVGYKAECIATGKEFIEADEHVTLDDYEVYETVQSVIRNSDY